MLSATQIEKIRNALVKNYNERLPVIFGALGDPCRFFIFQLLLLKREVCVTDVAHICNKTVSAASQQLKILALAGIIEKQKMGQMVCFALKEKDPLIKALVKMMSP